MAIKLWEPVYFTVQYPLPPCLQETPPSGETSSLEGKPAGEGEEQERKVHAHESGEAKDQENGYNTDHLNGQGRPYYYHYSTTTKNIFFCF